MNGTQTHIKKKTKLVDDERKFFINAFFIVSYFASDLFTFCATIFKLTINNSNNNNNNNTLFINTYTMFHILDKINNST